MVSPTDQQIQEALKAADSWENNHRTASNSIRFIHILRDAFISAKKDRDAVIFELGLLQINLDHKSLLLESCEKALAERDAKIERYRKFLILIRSELDRII